MSYFSNNYMVYFTISWILLGLIIFVLLLYIKAPYGKHYSNNWGPEINNKLG